MLNHKTKVTLPAVGLSGFEPPMSQEELAIQSSVHRFAKDVLRPLGVELDRMSAEEVVAAGSPYYGVFGEFAKLGIDPSLLAEMPPEMAVRVESLIGEELGWGDAGLAVSLGVAGVPLQVAASIGNQELVDLSMNKIGCWIATQPDRGSDATMLHHKQEWPEGKQGSKGNLTAKVGADEVVINGQSSAWISNGAVAQVAVAYMTADYGNGFFAADGSTNGVGAIVPLDLPGVSRGKPLDKMGQRSLPQGEIYFDNVKIPRRWVIGDQDGFHGSFASVWSFGGTHMAQVFTGVARAAFELALKYCNERKQGGALLIEHQMTRMRLGEMLRRVEMARAIARRSLAFARQSPQTHPYVTAIGKVAVTEEAARVVEEALRLFGGVGTTREYPIEKLYRDTSAALIEDGENRVLTMRLGALAQQLYTEGWTQN